MISKESCLNLGVNYTKQFNSYPISKKWTKTLNGPVAELVLAGDS